MTFSLVRCCYPPKRFCFHVREQKIVRWWQIRNMHGGWSTRPVQSHSHAHQPLQPHASCAGVLSWWNRTRYVSFPDHFEMSLVPLFQCTELLIQCGFIWKETMQKVSGKVDCNAWHAEFIAVAQLLLSQPMNFSVHPWYVALKGGDYVRGITPAISQYMHGRRSLIINKIWLQTHYPFCTVARLMSHYLGLPSKIDYGFFFYIFNSGTDSQ